MRDLRWGSLVLLFVVALGCSGVWILYPYPDSLRIKWIVISLLILGQCAVAGSMVNGRLDGILIDDRNRINLERFQWVAWLIVLLGGYFVECFANVAAGQSFPTIQPQLLILLGIVSASHEHPSFHLSLKAQVRCKSITRICVIASMPFDADALPSETTFEQRTKIDRI